MAENNGFFSGFLKSLFGRGGQLSPGTPPDAGATPAVPSPATEGEPINRRLYLWGRDQSGTPGFLVLFGQQGARVQNGQRIPDGIVAYTDYAVLRGKEGHFPSFPAVKILHQTDYATRTTNRRLYDKRNIRGGYWADPENALDAFFPLTPPLHLPADKDLPHREAVRLFREQRIPLEDFILADDPAEVLRLGESLAPYTADLIALFANPRLYSRKKALAGLLAKSPDKKLWQYLLARGSSELVAGLFLAFAQKQDNSLLTEARQAMDSPHSWADEGFAAGIRRTAELYVRSLDETARETRLHALEEALPQLRFYPVRVGGKDIPEGRVLSGAVLRKYSLQGLLSAYYYEYNREERRSVRRRREGLYPKSEYSDSVALDRVRLKSTIQELEIYGAAELLGRAAYYLDAPGLVYHLQGNGQSKALRYFQRYLTRILDSYAAQDEDRFMKAMVQLLTSYTPADYCCKFPGNFQFNYFIAHYLYRNLDRTPPTGWYERSQYMATDQLLRAEGRYEFLPELWDRRLEQVAEIAARAQVDCVLKAVFQILCDPGNREQLDTLPYPRLVALTASPYPPSADLGLAVLRKRLAAESVFRAEVLTLLLRSEREAVQGMAREYFERSGGALSPQDLAGLLLLPDLGQWESMILAGLDRLDGAGVAAFFRAVADSAAQYDEAGLDWDGPLADLLDAALNYLDRTSPDERAGLAVHILDRLQAGGRSGLSTSAMERLAEVVFTLPPEELRTLAQTDLTALAAMPGIAGLTGSLLDAVRRNEPPEDGEIGSLLESGGSRMIRALTELLTARIDRLGERPSTLLLLLEAEVPALQSLARSAFEGLPADRQAAVHTIILDSPQPVAYGFGLQKLRDLYDNASARIPEAILLHLLEHPAPEVKAFLADKLEDVLLSLGGGSPDVFLYYARTLLLLPNRLSPGKDRVCEALPGFVEKHGEKREETEALLLEIGGSNTRCDAERALVALARLRLGKEAV